MKINTRSTKGFTLVEIMIVVVIIGLLAAMAIPAFKKVRENSIGKAMENDARQIASASQQYFLENAGVTTIPLTVTTTTGILAGDLAAYVKQISKGTSVSANIVLDTDFTMTNPQYQSAAVQSFNSEGKKL